MGQQLTFADIFKKSFLGEAVGQFSLLYAAVCIGIALIIGIAIYLTYKASYTGVLYSKNFAISLLLMTVITCTIIITISSNIVLSLGMVGALSIVRFRTAVKDALDIMYLFWGISMGIICGAGLFPLAAIGTAIIAALVFIFKNISSPSDAYLLIVSGTSGMEDAVLEQIKNQKCKYKVRSKTISNQSVELNIEVRIKKNDTTLADRVANATGVQSMHLVSFEGENAI